MPELECIEVLGQVFVMMAISQLLYIPEDTRLESLKVRVNSWSVDERAYMSVTWAPHISKELPRFKCPVKLGL